MKKRLLASLLSLCLIVGLLPTAVLAVKEETGSDLPPVCTCEAHCAEGAVDETCPVCTVDYTACTYTAPVESEEETTKEPAEEPEIPLTDLTPAEPVEEEAAAADELGTDAAPLADAVGSGICGAEGSDVKWAVTANEGDPNTYTLTISGTGAMADYVTNGKQPYSKYMGSITNISLSDGITYIGNHALRGTKITSLHIPASVKEIGTYALIQNKELKEIVAADSSEERAFRVVDDVIYTSYTRSDKTQGWELSYFPIAKYTEEFTVPAFVTSIGANAMQMAQFDKVTFQAPCSINSYAFHGNTDLTTVVLFDGTTFGTEGTNIGGGFDGTFLDCSNLTTVENFESADVQKLANRVFQNTKVTNLIIPNTVTEITSSVFTTKNSISVIFETGSRLETVDKGAFTDGKYSATFSATDIDAYLNFVASGLEAKLGGHDLPKNDTFLVEWNGENTLAIVGLTKGSDQENITIPAEIGGFSVTEINEDAFKGNTSIKTVAFAPGAPITVGKEAFYNCTSMASFDAGMREISLQDKALGLCSSLKSVYVPNASDLGQRIFSMTNAVDEFLINSNAKLEVDSLFKSNVDKPFMSKGTVFVIGATANDTNIIKALFQNEPNTKVTELIIGSGSMFPTETDFASNILATPIKQGYTFGGWYDNENFTGNAVTSPTAGQPYYARWTYEITFNGNGATGGSMTTQQVTEGDKTTTLTANTFTKTGYTFNRWNTAADGNGISYGADAVASTVSNGTTLYAQWKANTYTIQFDGGSGASGSTASVTATYDQPATLTANGFTMAGKKFQGWAVESDKTAVKYMNGAKVQNLTDVNGEEVTLYAVWGDKDAWNPTWTQQTKTYNGQVQSFDLDAGFSATYQQNGQTVEPKNAGNYDVVISAAETADKLPYTYTFTNGLVINKAPLTIQAEDKTIRAGKDLPEFTYTTTGLVSGETLRTEPTLTCDTDGKTPGEYPIVPSNADAWNNYEISYVEGTLTVTKRSSGGGSSSSGSSSGDYTVSVDADKHGTVTVSPKRADKGDTVTITVKPDKGYELDELTVTDKHGDTVKLKDKGNGKFTFTMPGSKVTVEAGFKRIDAEPEVPAFADVPADAYYADAVAWAVKEGITTGTSATTFTPNASCTRAQMVTFLWRANGSPKATGVNPFTDVSADAYYYEAVLWAAEKGITSGTTATTFSPNATLTRGQTVTFLWRANGSPAVSGSSFGDVAADAYYANAVAWAVSEGITSGTGGNNFSPDAPCTRAQIVTFMYRVD